MRQRETVKYIAQECGLPRVKVKQLLESLNELARKELEESESFSLYKIGKLKKVQRKARIGRNLTTGEEVRIPARERIIFTVGNAFIESIS